MNNLIDQKSLQISDLIIDVRIGPVRFDRAMSWILASLHVSYGFTRVAAVVGEFLGADQGVGLLISTAPGS